jgi:NADPH-dependent F420 reductase
VTLFCSQKTRLDKGIAEAYAVHRQQQLLVVRKIETTAGRTITMDIAIIGTGNVGRALATSLTRAGHHVTLAARDETKTREVAQELGADAAAGPREAVPASDAVILAVPFAAATEVAQEIAPVAAGKVVIDVTNPLNADYSGLATAPGTSAAETVAEQLPEAHVVKAFNTLFASIQADPTRHGVTVDGLYATDDAQAAGTVAEVIESMGLRPVNAGGLKRARELEAIAFLNIQLQLANGGTWDTAVTLVAPPAKSTELEPIAA